MAMKTRQLQIRVTARQKAEIRRLARSSGQSLSAFVLSRILPEGRSRFAEILHALRTDDDPRYALAELHDLLASQEPAQYASAVGGADLSELSPLLRNTVAAMVEEAGRRLGMAAPAWAARVEPLDMPHFAVPFASVRLHLLRSSPVAFKRRNLFVDATIGARV